MLNADKSRRHCTSICIKRHTKHGINNDEDTVYNMWGSICVLSAAVVLGRGMKQDGPVAKGLWQVLNLQQCENPDQYLYNFDMKRHKLNRTHDVFDIKMDMIEDVTNSSHGVYIESCKKVDGGCKLYYTYTSESFCDLMHQYAEGNFVKLLTMAGYENPDCPIAKSTIEVEDFMFNYSELPEDGMPGEFKSHVYLLKGGERVGCFMVDLKFILEDDDD